MSETKLIKIQVEFEVGEIVKVKVEGKKLMVVGYYIVDGKRIRYDCDDGDGKGAYLYAWQLTKVDDN